jgi:Co/Zn/Cd efflux system component
MALRAQERAPSARTENVGKVAGSRRRTLAAVLVINLVQCALGLGLGVWAGSTAVIGAALDNLADASVYGVNLYVLGRAQRMKARAARFAGWLMIALAALLVVEVLRRFFGGEEPLGGAMIGMAALNVALNLVCLRLLSRHSASDVSFQATAIFTSNDSIINLSIIASGALVLWLGSNVPDLLLGLAAACVAAHGGKEILEEAKEAR